MREADLGAAIGFFEGDPDHQSGGERAIQRCVELAGLFAQHRRRDIPETIDETMAAVADPMRSDSDGSIGLVLEHLRELRQKFFADDKPPFPGSAAGYKRAERWIRKSAAESPDASREGDRDGGSNKRSSRLRFYLSATPGDRQGTEADASRTALVKAPAGTPVALLADETDYLSKARGASQEDLVRYLLCGVMPYFPTFVVSERLWPARVQDDSGETIPVAPRVVVTLFEYPTDEIWRSIKTEARRRYREIRRDIAREEGRAEEIDPLDEVADAASESHLEMEPSLGRAARLNGHTISETERRVAELVDLLEGIPARGRMRFYERVAERYNEKYGASKTAGAIQKMISRLRKMGRTPPDAP